MSKLFDKTTRALGTSIDFRLLRQGVTTANIANAETPDYKAKKVDFEQALARAIDTDGLRGMAATSNGHSAVGGGGLSSIRANVYDNPEGNVTNDGNTVDMEKEMAKLSENTILYKAALRLINKKLAAMRYVATEGNR